MDFLNVDTGSVATGSTQITETATVARALIAKLDGYLGDTRWMGQAAEACQGSIAAYQDFSLKLNQVLDNLGVDVGTAGVEHDENDTVQSAGFNQASAAIA
ncbi:hypothetical protein LX16_1106 [Stackebrandtia albiflava]|uniref:WXG100 family type VII secretion target n=1 Tax=Stackebrandtia albiflava TaxID=406432 RepID=A0A562VBZ1_9ACTN|nr:hypothetical protein [Stackebrandtia albiflava]TWJ15403.1 hypothetical protein LX16_1106 [Stackebrandtia albiflava]